MSPGFFPDSETGEMSRDRCSSRNAKRVIETASDGAKKSQSRGTGVKEKDQKREQGPKGWRLDSLGQGAVRRMKRGGRTKEAAGPLHPRSYYNRSSESLLKRVYTGLGVDSGRVRPSAPNHPRSLAPANSGFRGATPYVHERARVPLCVRSNAYLIVACMNSESRSTRGYEPDPS